MDYAIFWNKQEVMASFQYRTSLEVSRQTAFGLFLYQKYSLISTKHVSSGSLGILWLVVVVFWIFVESPYISLHDFPAINDSMRTRVRHFDPNFWQWKSKLANSLKRNSGYPRPELTLVYSYKCKLTTRS